MTGATKGVVDLSAQPEGSAHTADVCVVGSGCGGATAARLLAEAGRDVVVLEEGGDFAGARLTQREGAMYDQLYMDRGGRATEDLGVSVLQGRALGGGPVINMGDVVPIPEGVLAHWRKMHGLSALTPEALRPHLEAALVDLSASLIPDDLLNRANGLLRDGARSLGWRAEPMMHNRVGCAGLGTCLIGCPLDAKQGPRFVSIPRAIAAGARVLVRARAVRIEARGDAWRVVVRGLDPKGYHEVTDHEVVARTVVVAANAVASAQLLLRSGLGNEHVGRNLTLQPQLPIVAFFREEVRPFEGIPQSVAVTEFEQHDHPEHGLWGFRIEGVMGTPGIVSTMLPFVGGDAKALMTLYPRLAASLLLVPDAPSGRVELRSSGRPLIRYEHRDDHKVRLRAAAKAAARAYLAAGAERVLVPVVPPIEIRSEADLARIDDMSLLPATAPLISAHQQGSVRMAPSPRDGALDPTGALYGARGIYVLDSSGFPTSASSHTMTPIITMSRYLTTRMLAERAV